MNALTNSARRPGATRSGGDCTSGPGRARRVLPSRGASLGLALLILAAPVAAQPADPVAYYLPVAMDSVTKLWLGEFEGSVSSAPLSTFFVNSIIDVPQLAQVTKTAAWAKQVTVPSHLDGLGHAESTKVRNVLGLGVKRISYKEGAQDANAAIAMRWAFRVTPSDEHPEGEVLAALVSGTLHLRGALWVYGSGSARYEARMSVEHRLDPELGGYSRSRVVASQVIASDAIQHTYDYSVDLGIGLAIGDGVEVSGSVGASRGFSFERKKVRDDSVPFAIPALLQVGGSYELEFTLLGEAESRGLQEIHRAAVRFGVPIGVVIPKATAGSAEEEVGPADPSHMLDAMAFFQLGLPNLSIGESFTGNASFKFPKLGSLAESKIITVTNGFKMEPAGPVDKVQDLIDILGFPANPAERMAASTLASSDASAGLPELWENEGAWFEELAIAIPEP